jgi:hypothetical protein
MNNIYQEKKEILIGKLITIFLKIIKIQWGIKNNIILK